MPANGPGAPTVRETRARAIARPGRAKPATMTALARSPVRFRYLTVRYATGARRTVAVIAAATETAMVLSRGEISDAGSLTTKPEPGPLRNRARPAHHVSTATGTIRDKETNDTMAASADQRHLPSATLRERLARVVVDRVGPRVAIRSITTTSR